MNFGTAQEMIGEKRGFYADAGGTPPGGNCLGLLILLVIIALTILY